MTEGGGVADRATSTKDPPRRRATESGPSWNADLPFRRRARAKVDLDGSQLEPPREVLTPSGVRMQL